MDDIKKYGRANFESYCLRKNGVTYDNKPIPKWEDLPDDVVEAWCAGAATVAGMVIQQLSDEAKQYLQNPHPCRICGTPNRDPNMPCPNPNCGPSVLYQGDKTLEALQLVQRENIPFDEAMKRVNAKRAS